MAEKFSAQYYVKMSQKELEAEAKALKVDLYGKSRNQQIDAVYNAELRRRQDEQAEREANEQPAAEPVEVQDEPTVEGYEALTVADLRELAEQRGVDLDGITRKADIIAALEADDAEQGDANDEETDG